MKKQLYRCGTDCKCNQMLEYGQTPCPRCKQEKIWCRFYG